MDTADSTRARRVVALAFVTVFLDLVGFGIVFPLFPFYVKSLGGTPETLGVILSSFSFTQLVSTPFLGRLSDRVGRRGVILVSLAGNAFSMVLFALATKLGLLWLFFVSRILAGATAGNISACQAAIADVTSPENRAEAMGRLGAGIGLGMVLGPVLGGVMSNIGPWAPPLAAGALAIADLIAAYILMPETNAQRGTSRKPGAARPSLTQAVRGGAVLVVFALYFLTFLYMTTLQVALALLASARFAWNERDMGLVFTLFGLVMFVIQGALIGRITKAWGARAAVIAGSVASACGLLLIATAFRGPQLIAGVALLGIGLGIVNPCLSTLASESAGPESKGAVLGLAQSSGGLARTMGPTLGGILYQRIGIGSPFIGGAVAAVTSVALGFALLGKRETAPRRREEDA